MSTPFIALHRQYPGRVEPSKAKEIYASMPETYRLWVQEETLVRYLISPSRQSLLWHDYEAGGTDASSVAPLQFAAVRTDLQHNYLDEPMDIYCRLAGDKLPHPAAIAITGINPQKCQADGLAEPVFFRLIESEMAVPGTCVAGQNSMKYDEEVTRFGLWRNLLPVYEREYANNNSRWDLLPVLATYCALNVPGIIWPAREDDPELVSLKLEHLAKSNGITQENAHNAIDDVKALIGVSALLQSCDSGLWDLLFGLRSKKRQLEQVREGAVGLFFSAANGAKNRFMSPLLLIGTVPGENNKWVGVELNQVAALRSCFHAPIEDIKRRLYMTSIELDAEGSVRPPLRTMAVNKAPVFLSSSWLCSHEPDLWHAEWDELAAKVLGTPDFLKKLRNAFVADAYPERDAELSLYAGFPSPADKGQIQQFQWKSVEDVVSTPVRWDNPVYHTLWQRARWKMAEAGAIPWSDEDWNAWKEHCLRALQSPNDPSSKHERVNLDTVDQVLADTEMSEELRSGYQQWLLALRQKLLPNE